MNVDFNDEEFVNKYIEMVKGYDSRFILEKFRDNIDTSKTILELGCGIGLDYFELKKYYNITASDYSDVFIKKLKNISSDNFLKIDAKDINITKKFDVIFSNKVLQVFNDEELIQSFKSQYKTLNQNGMIFHCMWFGESSIRDFNYINIEKLEKVLNNLFTYELVYYSEFEKNDSVIVIGRKIQ